MINFVGFEPLEPTEEIKMCFDLIDNQGVKIVTQIINKVGNKTKFSDFAFVFNE